MRYKITLSYDGSRFCGWQIQNDAITVQECLQNALSTLLKEETAVTGAGRTDSKVNAISYVAHFETAARDLDAVEYKYFIHRRKDPFMNGYSYLYTFRIDVEIMNEAAALLLGEHDFSCFEKVGSDNKTSICKVSHAKWETYTPGHVSLMGYPAPEDDYLVFTIRADRFLRNMVRAVVGSLLEIGRGRHDIDWMKGLLQGGTRSDAGESVPGHALFLTKVEY